MSEIKVAPINVELVKAGTDDVPVLFAKTQQLIIDSQEKYETASVILKDVKARAVELDKQLKAITTPLDTAKKAVMDLFRKPLEMLEDAERTIKRSMIEYTEIQEAKAREEQARLQKLADEKAERERKKIEAKIARAEASGKTEKVESLQEQKEAIETIVVPTVQIETPKVQGVSFKLQYKAVVEDFNLLPNEYKLPNQSALNKVANATKGSIKIPGVKFISEKILASRK